MCNEKSELIPREITKKFLVGFIFVTTLASEFCSLLSGDDKYARRIASFTSRQKLCLEEPG